jgi:hypothetical protein
MAAFSPISQGTYRITVGTSAVTLALPPRPTTVRIFNATAANIVYFDTTGNTATIPVANSGTGSMPLSGGAGSIPLLVEKGHSTTISFIASAASTDVYVTLGLGDTVG